jgi:T-complex protein 1 subunit delta
MDNAVVVNDYAQMDRIFKEERKYILKMVKKIVQSGCNVLLIQKSILRDAVNDLALHYLSKKKIMVVKDIERTEVEFISKTLGVKPVADVDEFTADKLALVGKVEELGTADGRIIKLTEVANPGQTVCCLVRGSNTLMMDEAERSVHDALCVIRCLVKEKFLIAGGGAPEMQLSIKLEEFALKEGGLTGYCIKAFARALEVRSITSHAVLPIIICLVLAIKHSPFTVALYFALEQVIPYTLAENKHSLVIPFFISYLNRSFPTRWPRTLA